MTREELEKTFAYHMTGAALEFQDKYTNKSVDSSDLCEGFEAGAEWAQKFIVERACEWLRKNTTWECNFYGGNNPNKNKIEDFRKAMEE